MSWGDGKYFDYCLKISNIAKKRKLNGNRLKIFLDSKWNYVKKNCNIDFKSNFILDFNDFFYKKKKYELELTNIRGPFGMKIVIHTESKPIKD